MLLSEFIEKYSHNDGHAITNTAIGKRFWLTGVCMGATAITRLDRKVRPTLTEYNEYASAGRHSRGVRNNIGLPLITLSF